MALTYLNKILGGIRIAVSELRSNKAQIILTPAVGGHMPYLTRFQS